jgi:hypothetical protein
LQPDLLLEPDPGSAADNHWQVCELWADFTSRRNYAHAHLRPFIRQRLLHEGHRLQTITEAVDNAVADSLKTLAITLKTQRKQDQAVAVASAPAISRTEADRLRRFQQDSTTLQRHDLMERLGLDHQEPLTPEMVLWGSEYAAKAQRLACVLNLDHAIALDVQRLQRTTASGEAPLPFDQSYRAQHAEVCLRIGLRDFLEAFPLSGLSWNNDTPEVKALAQRVRFYQWQVQTVLGLTVQAKGSDTALVGSLLQSLGITTSSQRRGSGLREYSADKDQLRLLLTTSERLQRKRSGLAPPLPEKGAVLNKPAGVEQQPLKVKSLQIPLPVAIDSQCFPYLEVAITGH